MNTESCDMVRCHDDDAVLDGPPGSFYITETEAGKVMWLKLPDGVASAINLRPHMADTGPNWEWDGNEDKPTLTPSVHRVGSWHGFVRNGRMESC